MRSFTYELLPGRVVFGAGTIVRLPFELDVLEASRVVLISDNMAKTDADQIESDLGGRVVGRIGEIEPHVPIEKVEAARRLTDDRQADAVVTIGGGSTTGVGKAIVLEKELSFLAIPTTYAGSEMTPIYGITAGDVKRTGRDPRVKPKTVIYDVDLTLDLPTEVTSGSTMNALAHCVEALYAQERSPIVSIMALEGIRALKRGSVVVAGDPGNVDGRSDLLYGAFLAGASLGAVGMAIHHRICHVLGGTFGLAHGDANAVILPHVVAYNRGAEPEVMAALADALGVAEPAQGIRDLAETLGAPTSLSDLGIKEPDLDRATEMIVDGGGYNPRSVERKWIRQLLEDAFTGRPPSAQ
ncbi:MAG: maleylacetate reductase [Acidimicrobiia bacterium]